MARVHGLSEKITPRRNVWGEKITRDNKFSVATGVYISKEKFDEIDNELGELGYIMGFPSKTIKIPKEMAEQLGIREENRNIA